MKQGITCTLLRKIVLLMMMSAILLLASACTIRPISWSEHKVNIDQEEKVQLEGINKITVGTASADIKVIVTDEKELKFHYYGNVRVASADKDFAPHMDINEGVSTLAFIEKITNGLNSVSYSGGVKLDIYMPKKYVENIKLNTASGEVDIRGFEGSGDINTASGDITIDNCKGDFSANTASGHISYKKGSVLNNNLSFNSVSGNIDIGITKDSEFLFKARTVSGKIKCDFPITLEGRGAEGTVGNGKNSVNVNTVSGSISIKKN